MNKCRSAVAATPPISLNADMIDCAPAWTEAWNGGRTISRSVRSLKSVVL